MRGKKTTTPKTETPESYTKQPRRRRNHPLLVVLLLIPFMFLVFAIVVVAKATPPTANTGQAAQQTQSTSAPQAHIGQTVSDAGFNFVVNSIKCGETRISSGGTIYVYANAQGQYCRLNVTVTNTGNSANSIDASDQYVYNSQGQQYTYASDATAAAADYYYGSPFDNNINPGNSVTGDIVYDVPVGVTPTTAEFHGDYDSAGARVGLQ